MTAAPHRLNRQGSPYGRRSVPGIGTALDFWPLYHLLIAAAPGRPRHIFRIEVVRRPLAAGGLDAPLVPDSGRCLQSAGPVGQQFVDRRAVHRDKHGHRHAGRLVLAKRNVRARRLLILMLLVPRTIPPIAVGLASAVNSTCWDWSTCMWELPSRIPFWLFHSSY